MTLAELISFAINNNLSLDTKVMIEIDGIGQFDSHAYAYDGKLVISEDQEQPLQTS